MYTIGRDNHAEVYDFKSEENLKKWRGLFIPTLIQIQKTIHPNLVVKEDGLQYVELLLLKLLEAITTVNGNVISGGGAGGSASPLHTISDFEERIRRIIPDPLKTNSLKKAKEILAIMRNSKKSKANILFHGSSDRSPLKTPVDKFHNLLQKDVLLHKTDIQVSQYLLAILEFIATDILQLAGHYVRNIIQNEVTSQDIHATMFADKVLMEIFYNDEEDDEGPPLSANCYYTQSFFDTEFSNDNEHNNNNGEYGNVGNQSITYTEAVHEFIQEERQFIRELSLIIKVFRDPMTTVLSEEDLQRIFVNIDDIYEFAVKFLSLLESAVEVADEDDCPAIGSCFIEIAEDEEMDVFHKYALNVMNLSIRDHLYYVLSQHSIHVRLNEIFSSHYNNAAANGMMAAIKYVLPRLLLLPVYHCFSYFKAIEKLRDLTPSISDRENYEQADSTLQSLRNVLEREKKSSKFNDGYFLRLYGRTNKATTLAKMKEIQSSIDNWSGKDIWKSCNEFIREGILHKVSNTGKSIGHLSNRVFSTERRALLFDSLLVLCKLHVKRIVPGRDNSVDWRLKERFFIRNIEIIERDEPYVRSNFFSFSNHFIGHSDNQNSSLEQSSTSLSSSVSNISNHLTNDNLNTIHAFEISQTNQNQSIVLMAKTLEEKESWMSQLILLNMRSMLERTLDAKLLEEAKKHPLILPHASVYRFAVEDVDSNIIFEENKSNRNVPLIKGATLLKLIERLTYHKYGDPNLVRIFLTTYRAFCTPIELFKLLNERFEIPEPDFRTCMQEMYYANEDLSSPTSVAPPVPELSSDIVSDRSVNNASVNTCPTSPNSPTSSTHQLPPSTPFDSSKFFDEQDEQCQHDYREMLKRFRKEYAEPVQFRVLNVLRHWIDKHWYDFERETHLLEMLNEFLKKLSKSHTKFAKWCYHIQSVVDRKKSQCFAAQIDALSIVNVPIGRPLSSIMKINDGPEEFDLLEFSPGAIAAHLTLFEFDLYRAVQPYELIGMDDQSLVWTKKDKQKTSPNLLKMIRHNTIMSYYFEKRIVETENFEERVAIVTRIIEIMNRLMQFNNFNGVFEIVCALDSAPIHRLEHTRAQIERNSKLKKVIEEAKDLQDVDNHYKKYKEKLFSIDPPCVPFLGNFLTNIVQLEVGNPEYISPPNSDSSSHTNNNLNDNISLSSSANLQSASSLKLESDNTTTAATNKLINFQKKRRVYETISLIQQYQNEPYNSPSPKTTNKINLSKFNTKISSFFENLEYITYDDEEEKQFTNYVYNKSLEIEPRGCKQPPKFPRKWPDRNLKQSSKSRNIRVPGIIGHNQHQSLSSSNLTGYNQNQASNSHTNSIMMIDNCDSISLQQQQSPSTPLTPPGSLCPDPIFAPVMIGGDRMNNNGTPHISPTTPGMHSMSFFPTTSTWQQIPSQYHHQHSASSPLISSPTSSDLHTSTNKSPLEHKSDPPALPPKGINRNSSGYGNQSKSTLPLPPRTYKCKTSTANIKTSTSNTVTTGAKISYRDKGPAPLPPMPPPNHYHQRYNSDIVTTASSTSPSHISQSNGPIINRRNSTVENGVTLSPRRYSQVPPPPPLPPTPLTSSPQTPMMSQTLFNLLPGNGSPRGIHHNPSSSSPPLPPLSSLSHRKSLPLTSPTSTVNNNNNNNNASNSNNIGPELPPKTYRLSNTCR